MSMKIDYATYYDKVLGGWIGKFVGGTIGGPVEGVKDTLSLTYYQEMPEVSAVNDDSDFQVVWLHALEEYGPWLSARDLAREWLDHIWYPFCEYGYGVKNFRRGIYPPVSGWFNNSYYKESMGCPIRSEIWAFVAPGCPELACEYAEKDASLDHSTNSLWAERFFAAMESVAFLESDLRKVIEAGLQFVPEDSRLRACLRDTMAWHGAGDDWRSVRTRILSRYGSPDMTSAVQNIGFTLLALLESGGDFEKAVLTAANCGYDTDCTCATAGAIIGIMTGAEALPAAWKEPLHDTYTMGVDYQRPTSKMSDLAADTCAMGAYIARARETGVEIVNAPRIATPRITAPPPRLQMAIDYHSMPALRYGEATHLSLAIENDGEAVEVGRVHIDGPEHVRIHPQEQDVIVESGETQSVSFDVECREDMEVLPLTNLFKATLSARDEVLAVEEFGLSGSWVWRAFGPFWEGTGGFTNTVEFDKEYLPETRIDENLPLVGEGIPYHQQVIINSPEDRVPLEQAFQARGPMVLYLLQYVHCPDERDVWAIVGNSGGFKLWLNDALEMSDAAVHPYMPFDNCKTVRLRQGRNKVLVKLVRYGDEMDFSFGIRQVERNSWHQSQWTVDVGSGVV